MFTKPFQQLSKHDANIAGGKGASLGEMITSGIPVPDGFVVLSTTFDKFLEITDISIEIDAILNKVDHNEVHTVEDASKQIQALILSAKMPKDIAKEIKTEFSKLNCKYVAVRSSATAEDSASAAWAGQLDSFLNTTEETLLENVQRCFASLFTPRAIFYRFEKELHNQTISVAVVVQKMVNSKVSGIAFSVHPVTEDRNQIIIEAGFGLGEAIVSGQITPDSYVVTKDDLNILDKNIYTQERGIFRDDKKGGNEWRNISKNEAQEQCLSDKQIIELSNFIIKIENHYNFPCDIEWAMEDDIFYIVQSRPITTLKVGIAEKDKKEADLKFNYSDYILTFWAKGISIFAIDIHREAYKKLKYVYIFNNNTFKQFFNKKSYNDALDYGVEFYSGANKFLSYEKNINSLIKKLKQHFNFIKNKNELSFSDVSKLFEIISNLNRKYTLMNIEYTDKAFLMSENNQLIKNNIKKVESLKDYVRGVLDTFLFSRSGLLDVVFTILSRQFSIEKDFFYNLTRKEILNIINQKNTKNINFSKNIFVAVYNHEDAFIENSALKIIEQFLHNDIKRSAHIKGFSASKGKVIGFAKILSIDYSGSGLYEKYISSMGENCVLVAQSTNPDLIAACQKAVAIVTDIGGLMSHAAIISRELKKPCVVGTNNATQVLKDGDEVEVDADNGVVRILNRSKSGTSLVEKFIEDKKDAEITKHEGNFSLLVWGTAASCESSKLWKKYYQDEFGSILVLMENKRGIGFFDFNNYKKSTELTLDKFIKLKKFKELDDYKSFIVTVDSLYQANYPDKIKKLSTKDLEKNIIKLFALTRDWQVITLFCEALDEDIIKKYYKQFDIKNVKFKDFLEKTSLVDFDSFILKRDRCLLNFSSKNLYKNQWVFSNYLFCPQLKDLQKTHKDAIKELGGIKNIQNEQKTVKVETEKNKKIVKEFRDKLSFREKHFFDFIKGSIYIRDARKEYVFKLICLLSNFTREIFSRLAIDKENILYIRGEDFDSGIYKNPDYLDILNKRKKGVAVYYSKNLIKEEFVDFNQTKEKIFSYINDNLQQKEIRGSSACAGRVQSTVKIILDQSDFNKFKVGDILVTSMTRPEFVPLMKKASAIITDEGGVTCHAAIISRELNKSCIIGTKFATQILKDGDEVEVDADNGVVRILKKVDEISTNTREASIINFLNKKELLNFLMNNEFDVQSAKASFFMCDLVFSIYARFIKTNIGDFPVLSYLDSNNQFREIISKNDILKIGEYLYSRFEKGGIAEIKKMIRNQIEIEESLDSFKNQKGIDIKVYSDFINKFKKWWEYALLLEDKGQFSYQKIEELLLKRLGEEKTKKIMGDIFCSSNISVFSEERIHFYNICLRVFKDSEIKEKILKNKTRGLENSLLKRWHQEYNEKYFYFKTDFYERKEMTFNDFINDLKNEIISGDAGAISNKIKAIKKEFVTMKNKMKLARLELNKEELEVSDYINQLINWSDRRKIGMMKTLYYLLGFLKEISIEKKIEYGELILCSSDEVFHLLETGSLPKSKIRGDLFGCYYGDESKLFFGDEALEVFSLVNFETKNIVGQVASRGGGGVFRGVVRVINDPFRQKFNKDDILVTTMTRIDFVPIMGIAKAIITDEGGVTSHAAIVSRELGVPCIIGTKIATQLLKDGDEVEIDMDKGIVKILSGRDESNVEAKEYIDIKKFKESIGDREYITQQGNISIALLGNICNAIQEKYISPYGYKHIRPVLTLQKGSHGVCYFDLEMYRDFSRISYSRIKDSIYDLPEYQDYIKLSKIINREYKNFSTPQELGELKSKVVYYFDLAKKYLVTTLFCEAVDHQVVEELAKKLKVKDIDKFVEIVSLPTRPSFVNHQNQLFLEGKDILWSFATYFSAPNNINREKLLNKKRKDFSKKEVEEEIKRNKLVAKENQKLVDNLMKKSSVGQRRAIEFVQASINMRDERKEFILKMFTILSDSLRALAKKYNISYEMISTMADTEIDKLDDSTFIESLRDRFEKGVAMISYSDKSNIGLVDYELARNTIFDQSERKSSINGICANKGSYTGLVRIIISEKDFHQFQEGEILVTGMTRAEYVPLMRKAGAIITDEGGITCHAAIVSRELGIPCIIGTKIATQVLKDGDEVEVDADNGVVRILNKKKDKKNKKGEYINNEADYKKIKGRGDLVLYIERKDLSVFVSTLCHLLEGPEIKKIMGAGWERQVCVMKDNIAYWLRDPKEIKGNRNIHAKFLEKKSKKYLLDIIGKCEHFNDNAGGHIKDLKKMSEDDFSRNIKKIINYFKDILTYTTIVPYFLLEVLEGKDLSQEKKNLIKNSIEKIRGGSYYMDFQKIFIPKLSNYLSNNYNFKKEEILNISYQELLFILDNKEINDTNLINRNNSSIFWFDNKKKVDYISYNNEVFDFFVNKYLHLSVDTHDNIKGNIANKGFSVGRAVLVNTYKDLGKVKKGDIIISRNTNPSIMPALIKCSAIVTDEGGIACHAAIVSRELNKPCIIGTKIATRIIKDGDEVEVDADNGIVRIIKRKK